MDVGNTEAMFLDLQNKFGYYQIHYFKQNDKM